MRGPGSELGIRGNCGNELFLEVVIQIQQMFSFCCKPFSCMCTVHILVMLNKS